MRSSLMLTTIAVTLLAANIASAKLLGHWSFDVIANREVPDVSGNGRNARIHGAPESVAGVSGSGLRFKTNDDYVDVGAPVIPRRDFSISVWVNCDDTDKQFFLGQYSYGHPQRLDLAVRESSVRIQVNEIVDTAKLVEPKKWYHLVYTREGDTLKIFVNGKQVITASLPTDVIQTENLIIGKIFVPKQTSFRFQGVIDELKIWDSALSETEVRQEFDPRPPATPTGGE